MKTVTTLEEVTSLMSAINFFLNNSSGNCIAIKNGIEKEISCYPEAGFLNNSYAKNT